MKYRFTFSFALITILLVANNIKAETIQKNIGGLYYSLNTESKEAKVIRNYSASLSSIDIPESVEDEFGNTYSVTCIGENAFADCTNLSWVNISNSVTIIEDWAFGRCYNLMSVKIGNSVTSIGERAFCSCFRLISISLPNSLNNIGKWAFTSCDGLTSLSIPNSVTSIDDYAFSYCMGLKTVTIGNSISKIGHGVFVGCSGLNEPIVINDSFIFLPEKYNGHYVIPNNVTKIIGHAFENCDKVTSITIPNTVKSIGYKAFWCCSALTSIVIPNSVSSIGAYSFGGCRELSSITIGNSVKSIGTDAFYNSCHNLQYIKLYTTIPPTLDNSIFSIGKTIYVPSTSIDAYNVADFWKDYAIEPINELFLSDNNKNIETGKYIIGDITYTRTGVSEGKFGTFCLPFDIDLSETNCFQKVYTPLNVCFYNTSTEKIQLLFKEIELNAILPSNTPFVAKLTGNDVVLKNHIETSFPETIEDAEPMTIDVFDYNGVSGALLENTNIDVKFGGTVLGKAKDDRLYTFNTNGSFGPASSDLNAFRAYVLVNEKSVSSSVKGIIINFDGIDETTTAIEMIHNHEQSRDNFIYTIEGKRINSDINSLPKGIYIINNKKILK